MDVSRTLFETTYTKKNFHSKVTILKEFFSNHFFKENSFENKSQALHAFLDIADITEQLKDELRALPNEYLDQFTRENYAETLDGNEKEVEAGPMLKLYVPTTLPPNEVAKLGNWARENVQANAFIDLSVDPRALGGCMFVWNGVHHDYSFRYHFDKHRNEVKTLIRNFDSSKIESDTGSKIDAPQEGAQEVVEQNG